MGALSELLKALQEAHPERLARAAEQGYDTSKIYLHGTNNDIDAFNNLRNPNGNYFSNSVDAANNYATKFGTNYEGSNIIPVFLNKDKAHTTYYIWGNKHNPYPEQVRMTDPSDVRSIYANFDPAKQDSSDLLASKLIPGAIGAAGAGTAAFSPKDSKAETGTSLYSDPLPNNRIGDEGTSYSNFIPNAIQSYKDEYDDLSNDVNVALDPNASIKNRSLATVSSLLNAAGALEWPLIKNSVFPVLNNIYNKPMSFYAPTQGVD